MYMFILYRRRFFWKEILCEFEVFIGYWSWQIFDNGKYCFFFFFSQCQFVKGCMVIRKWLKVEYPAHSFDYSGYGTFLPLNSILKFVRRGTQSERMTCSNGDLGVEVKATLGVSKALTYFNTQRAFTPSFHKKENARSCNSFFDI